MEEKDPKKTVAELLKEEQDKLLSEINEKSKKRKQLMNPNDDKHDIDHDFLK